MKIRIKLFLVFLATIMLLSTLFCVTVLNTCKQQLEKEKLAAADSALNQVLISYDYAAKDILTYLVDTYHQEDLAHLINGNRTEALTVQRTLEIILRNNQKLEDGFLVSENGTFFSNGAQSSRTMRELWEAGLFESGSDTLWIMDGEDNLYIRRNIYQVFPYRVVGYGVFKINLDYFRMLVGMNNISSGDIYILNAYGETLLTSAQTTSQSPLLGELLERLHRGEKLPGSLKWNGKTYYIVGSNGISGGVKGIYAVAGTQMLATYYTVLEGVVRIVICILSFAAVLSFLIAHGFTRRIHQLRKQIVQITRDNRNDLGMRVSVAGNDEIGELAVDFNHLLEEIESVYKMRIRESQEKQNIRYELLEWQYRALISQVSPHFLCNIMSSICMLAAIGNADGVQRLAVNASTYLRSNMNNSEHSSSTVQEEIRMAQEYLTLMNQISAMPIRLITECQDGVEDILIPSYILQPLIENSVKHGMSPDRCSSLVISITARMECGERLALILHDNGLGYSQTAISEIEELRKSLHSPIQNVGFGIKAIIRRLALQYQSDFSFCVENLPEGGAQTIIEIPLPHSQGNGNDREK